MPRKGYTPEQIINKHREAEVLMSPSQFQSYKNIKETLVSTRLTIGNFVKLGIKISENIRQLTNPSCVGGLSNIETAIWNMALEKARILN
jgi:hypothetical protein